MPRKTTDFGALFDSLVEDLRIQIAASMDQSMSEMQKRIARLEKRLEQLDPSHVTSTEEVAPKRPCSVCGKPSVARGLCSAHYQQWRYRVRKAKARAEAPKPDPAETAQEKTDSRFALSPAPSEISQDN
ncbi:MAG: hypothetical protein AAF654_11095 [Myxococcota bacterium]